MSELYSDDICYILEATHDIWKVISFLHKTFDGSVFYETDVDGEQNYCCLRFRPENKYYILRMKEIIFKDAVIAMEDSLIQIVDFYETENEKISSDDDEEED